MFRIRSFLWGFFLTITLISSALHAPSASALAPAPTLWRSFTSRDGLITNSVQCITQSSDGTYWIGTEKGISRFDGFWKSYPGGEVLALWPDTDGTIWYGGRDGLHHYEREQWESVPFPDGKNRPVHTIWQGDDNRLWVGTDTGVWVLDDGIWSRPGPAGSGPAHTVYAITGSGGVVWTGGEDGLFTYREQQWAKEHIPDYPPGTLIFSVLYARDGTLWISTNTNQLFYKKNGLWAHIVLPGLPPHRSVWKLVQDTTGKIWAATDGYGVYVIGSKGVERHLTTSDGLTSEYVKSMWVGTEGALWFATLAGVNRYDPHAWKTQTLAAGLPVTSGTLGNAGEMWWGTFGKGLWHYSSGRWENWLKQNNKVPTDFIQTLDYAPGVGLWIGTTRSGLSWFNGKEWRTFGTEDGLPNNTVNVVLIAGPQDIWAGTEGGLARYFNNNWYTYTTANGLPDNHVYSLAEGNDGHIWVGTGKGCAALFDGKTWRVFTPANSGLPRSQRLQAIDVDNNGRVWFGSWGGGVTSFDGKHWQHFTAQDGLPSDAVYTLHIDPDDTLWVGTAGGVARYDGRTWISYTSEGSLPDNEVRVILRDPSGNHWFGTLRGNLSIYSREKLPPQVRIASVNGHPVEGAVVQVKSGETVHLSFVGGDTKTRTSDLMYLYRMEGIDKDWVWARSTRTAAYKSLKPGTYAFLVQAVDEDGNYSNPPATVQVQVLPPPSVFIVPLVKWTLPKLAGIIFVVISALLILSFVYILLTTLHRKRKARKAVERHFNPYIAGAPIMDEDLFFGREDQLKRLLSILHYNSVMIHGERRIGKTSLLRQLAMHLAKLNDPEYFFVPVFVDLEGTPEEEFFYTLMDTILVGLNEEGHPVPPREKLTLYTKQPSKYSDRDFRRDLRSTIAALQEIDPNKHLRLILLLDEIDTINGYSFRTQQQLRRLFMEKFAPFVGAVVAGVGISKEWDREESPWYNLFTEMELQAFTRGNAEELIREPVKGIYEFENDAVEFIWKHSKGKPHRIQQLCMEAVNSMLDDKRSRVTLDDAIQAFNHLVVTDETFREETM